MQSRRGPPIFQPFYDVLKLFEKQEPRRPPPAELLCPVLSAAGGLLRALFFAGSDLLLVTFALTLAAIFFVLGAYTASSPYSFIGAERELMQMMAYEPMVLLTPIGMYMVTRSFSVHDIAAHHSPLLLMLPGVFLGFLYALVIKFRKSPFDLSASHHAHQELVRGIMTEFSGPTLAMIEIAHWYENVFLLGWVYLFFASHPAIGLLAVGLTLVHHHLRRQRLRPPQMAGRRAQFLDRRHRARLRKYPVLSFFTADKGPDEHASLNPRGSFTTTPRAVTAATSKPSPASPPSSMSNASAWSTPATPSTPTFSSSPAPSTNRAKRSSESLRPDARAPNCVVAVGACACSGGIFRECYNICGGIDTVIPVDVYVPGCAARPEAIIDGVVKAIEILETKHRARKDGSNNGQQEKK
jgi:ech hydrogenase subunit B